MLFIDLFNLFIDLFLFPGVQRTRRRTCNRVWHKIHGNLCESFHQCRRSIFHAGTRHKMQNGETTGNYLKFFPCFTLECLIKVLRGCGYSLSKENPALN